MYQLYNENQEALKSICTEMVPFWFDIRLFSLESYDTIHPFSCLLHDRKSEAADQTPGNPRKDES
jgi:hypothetical protein